MHPRSVDFARNGNFPCYPPDNPRQDFDDNYSEERQQIMKKKLYLEVIPIQCTMKPLSFKRSGLDRALFERLQLLQIGNFRMSLLRTPGAGR